MKIGDIVQIDIGKLLADGHSRLDVLPLAKRRGVLIGRDRNADGAWIAQVRSNGRDWWVRVDALQVRP